MKVNEIFGPTFQGEGPSLGRRAVFLRLAGCNLDCSWCDTKYAQTGADMTPTEVAKALTAHLSRGLLVITGGEPLLQQDELLKLLELLHSSYRVEIETNGTISPRLELAMRASFIVSPKLSNSDTNAQLHPTWSIHQGAVFKFVCATQKDVEEVALLGLPQSVVWIMPMGRNVIELNQSLHAVCEPALAAGFNLTDRLHIRLWGGKRGH